MKKTKKKPDELKKEIETLDEQPRELTEEELKQVVGGATIKP